MSEWKTVLAQGTLDRPHAQPQDEAPPVIRRVRAGQV